MTELHVGFTGGRLPATNAQRQWMYEQLKRLYIPGAWFHHGDCEGKDEAAHHLARMIGYRIVIHPPISAMYRAWCSGATEVREEKPFHDRNHDIVDETSILLGVPDKPMDRQPRSGTWSTVRYGKRVGRKLGDDLLLMAPAMTAV